VILVDTNILAYLLIEGDRTPLAQALYERDPDWRSEAFILVEFSNILATYVRTQAITDKQGLDLLTEASGTDANAYNSAALAGIRDRDRVQNLRLRCAVHRGRETAARQADHGRCQAQDSRTCLDNLARRGSLTRQT
jgi:predicted nucleic acid-binding protein